MGLCQSSKKCRDEPNTLSAYMNTRQSKLREYRFRARPHLSSHEHASTNNPNSPVQQQEYRYQPTQSQLQWWAEEDAAIWESEHCLHSINLQLTNTDGILQPLQSESVRSRFLDNGEWDATGVYPLCISGNANLTVWGSMQFIE